MAYHNYCINKAILINTTICADIVAMTQLENRET